MREEENYEGDFCFLQTQPMEEERVKMGWLRFMAVFVIKTADFVIMGGLFVISGRVKRERLALAGHALSAGLECIRCFSCYNKSIPTGERSGRTDVPPRGFVFRDGRPA